MGNKESIEQLNNVNSVCYCGKPLKPIHTKQTLKCMCCHKQNAKDKTQFYFCGAWRQCEYYKITNNPFTVCSKCVNSLDNGLKENESFITKKISANLNIISFDYLYVDIDS